MATTKKGARVEPGIWKHPDGRGYLAEINYTDPRSNRRIRERKTIHRLDLARAWRQTRKADALRGEVRRRKDEPKPMTFSTLAEEYLENWSKVKKKASTYRRDRQLVARLDRSFGKKLISQITRRDVERYVADRKAEGSNPATVNRELCCLKNTLRKAVDWGYLETNPAWGVKQERESPPEYGFLTEAETDALLAVCGGQLRAIVTLAVYTGMRRGEIFKLEWRDVAFDQGENGMITVRDPKNRETRHIPMNTLARQSLTEQPNRLGADKRNTYVFMRPGGEPFTDVRWPYDDALKRAGIDRHFRFHDLRHTFASHLVMKGVDLQTVAKLGGWKTLQMVMRYAHLSPNHLQDAVDRLVERSDKL